MSNVDVLLDTDTGDLPVNARTVRDRQIYAQRLEKKLGVNLGEWRYDQTAGMPYLQWRLQKRVPVQVIRSYTVGVIRQLDFAESVTVTVDHNGTDVTISGSVTTPDGDVGFSARLEPPVVSDNPGPAIISANPV